MTGFRGFVLTSATGARSWVTPDVAQRAGDRAGDGLGQRRVVDLAERQRSRHRAPARRLEPRHVAALLVDRDDRLRRDADRRRQRPQLLRVADVAREEDDAAEPGVELAQQPRRRHLACEAGQDAGPREPLQRRAHPFTAPAVRPKAMRRCTSRKKTITGIAVSVEAAISAPQSVLRLVP